MQHVQAEPTVWAAFEHDLNAGLVRVYDLPTTTVRVDTTTASTYAQWDGASGGLFQFGHSKDHRPDLAQIKVPIAALDPLGMPLVTTVVPGNTADDPLYVPAIAQVQQSLDGSGGSSWATARWPRWRRAVMWPAPGISTCVRCRRCRSPPRSCSSCCSRSGRGNKP